MRNRVAYGFVLCVSVLVAEAPDALGAEDVDLATIHRIKVEAFRDSKVMDHLFWLTDVNGPRLTGSPGFQAAADWAVRNLKEWGATGARLEKWGTFGRGWSMSRFSAHMTAPTYAPLPGVPEAWTRGTDGPVSGEAVYAPLVPKDEVALPSDAEKLAARIRQYVEQQKGKLRGKVVLITAPRELEPPGEPDSHRYDDSRLASIANAPEPMAAANVEWPITKLPTDPKERERFMSSIPLEMEADYWERGETVKNGLNAFLRDEGVLAVLGTDARGHGAIVFAENGGSWESGAPEPPPVIALAPEPYDRMVRLVQKNVKVTVEVELAARYHDDAPDGVNVVAEIPGGKKKDEVVMLGGHLDSWHAGTGATDNAAGCAVVLEAFRILKALNLPMDRTVRLALWSGEEQALYGSRGYVKEHFGDPVTMAVKPEHARLAGYFNVDNGTGKIRGVYLQGNDMVRPIFEAWLAPFRDLGATTISIRNTGGTDHESFDAVGLPGFQFIQDPLDYGSRTHHSSLDVYDHLQSGDLMQASAVLASFVYNAAMRPEKLPRKPLPKPLPAKKSEQAVSAGG
jgi:carboxypeptidase Q